MNMIISHNRKGFYAFLALVVLTAFLPFIGAQQIIVMGLLAIIWGFFGFFRLLSLSHFDNNDIPKIFNLPVQILFGSGQREQQYRKLILQRMAQPDVLLWLFGSILFILRMIYYQLYVDQPDAAQTYTTITKLAFAGILVTLIFLSISYSQSREFLKLAVLILSPLALLTLIMALAYNNSGDETAMSLWGVRYQQLGLIGALGVYVLVLPALVMFVKVLFNAHRRVIKPLAGILSLITLLILDRMLVLSPLSMACTFTMLCLTAFLWGHTIRYRL